MKPILLGCLLLCLHLPGWAGINEWTYVGLDREYITAVAFHPTNPEIIYAAALDVVWDPAREGGVFKTTDGGITWDTLRYPPA